MWSTLSICTLLFVLPCIQRAQAINCYSCESSQDFSCSEFWDPSLDVNHQYLSDCRDVYDAKYCVKMTGIYDGKLGTKRFCSSRDWGNYCEYIQRPGDPREYRSCILTCTTDECNGAETMNLLSIKLSGFLLILISYILK